MASNFIQRGNTLTAIAPSGGVVSGDGVLIGNLFGVALTGASEGKEFEMTMGGVFSLPVASGASFDSFGAVSWDSLAGACAAPGPGRAPIGVAVRPTVAGVGHVEVRLDGVATAPAA